MLGRFAKDESGMTMALTVLMVVLIGVMGAGILTFVQRDLESVIEVNRGQRAFEMADAGIKAAKAQLDADSNRMKYDSTDVGVVDSPWAESKGGKNLSMDGSSANVQIRSDVPSAGSYRVISTGCIPDCASSRAKRKIEAIFKLEGGVGIPPTYFGRNNIGLEGTVSTTDISLFALGNVTKSGSSGDFSGDDEYFKKWAETGDSLSYPNPYNKTARSSDLAAVGALGTVASWYESRAPVYSGTTSCTSSSGIKMVADWAASTCAANRKVSFPFDTSMTRLTSDINALRQRAQDQEAATGYDHYRLNYSTANNTCTFSTWPAGSTYDTVVFYEFSSYSTSRAPVNYCGTNSSYKGVIVVVNGNFKMEGPRKFEGGIITYTNPVNASRGTFEASGNGDLTGYVNSTGNITISGTPGAGSVPALNSLPSFDGVPGTTSWRELYQ